MTKKPTAKQRVLRRYPKAHKILGVIMAGGRIYKSWDAAARRLPRGKHG